MMTTAIENPTALRYTATHEWARKEEAHTVTVGITHHAQEQLGDIVFVDLPEIGMTVNAGDDIVVVESVKTAADIYAPFSGEIVAVNDALQSAPEQVNEAPFSDGWLCKIKLTDANAMEKLLSAEQYTQQIHED